MSFFDSFRVGKAKGSASIRAAGQSERLTALEAQITLLKDSVLGRRSRLDNIRVASAAAHADLDRLDKEIDAVDLTL
jgi:hypothetical protein